MVNGLDRGDRRASSTASLGAGRDGMPFVRNDFVTTPQVRNKQLPRYNIQPHLYEINFLPKEKANNSTPLVRNEEQPSRRYKNNHTNKKGT